MVEFLVLEEVGKEGENDEESGDYFLMGRDPESLKNFSWFGSVFCQKAIVEDGYLQHQFSSLNNLVKMYLISYFFYFTQVLVKRLIETKSIRERVLIITRLPFFILYDIFVLFMLLIAIPFLLFVYIAFTSVVIIFSMLACCSIFYHPTTNPIYNFFLYIDFAGSCFACFANATFEKPQTPIHWDPLTIYEETTV